MTIYGYVLPGATSIARSAFLAGNLSAKAKSRIKILDWQRSHGGNISLTARHFGINRRLLREWRVRLAKEGPGGLEDRSRKPHQVRRPTIDPDIMVEVVRLRKKYPAWSKYKIQPLLPDRFRTSVSTVGRILKRRGLIDRKVSRKRSRSARHPRARFPRGMRISSPGDMVQMDTKYVMLPGGRKFYQFTAIDVLTKQRILDLYPSQSSRNGADFLNRCLQEFPFPIRTVQTDNGAPFQKEFDALCKTKGLPHYFTHPRSPKENTYVEISHGADEREFYSQGNICLEFDVMSARLKEWQGVWNKIRPHQALNYLTPDQYLDKWQTSRLPTKDVITLQT
jgi:transposase InsO family protein